MMNCEQAKALLSDFYDGELQGDACQRVERHIQGCAECSAELDAFRQLSSTVSSAPAPAPAADGWCRMAARLDAPAGEPAWHETPLRASQQADPSTSHAPVRIGPRLPGRIVVALAAALAASVLMMAAIRTPRTNDPLSGSSPVGDEQPTIALDYSTVIKQQASQPSQALAAVSARFQGREVATEDAEGVLGYRPAVMSALPAKTRLVSTRLLKLPNCRCAGGQCQCGPQGCNCAVCLCQRQDGSEFLVFEHCKTQNVSFGEYAPRVAAGDAREVQFVGAGKQLAASWVAGARRLTAIGLKDRAEAESLVATLDKVAMTR